MPDASGHGFRERLTSLFEGPGIDQAPLEDEMRYGWLSQSPDVRPDRLTAAAVLVPLIDHPGNLSVLLTRRTSHLRSHPGQVSFPGGKVEERDATAEDTALRETREEIGLEPDRIEVLGRLGQRTTGTGYQVTPVVGLVQPPLSLKPDPNEVEKIFEVPLSFVIDRRNHKVETRYQKGVERRFYVMPYGEFYIWGLTARLLVALTDLVDPQ